MILRITRTSLLLLGLTISAHAQLSIGNPSSSKVKSCDDYATDQLNNPFDMSSVADVNNFFQGADVGALRSMSFANGIFSAVTESNSATFHLYSPQICGAYPMGGRYGQYAPIDTSKYTKLSMKMYTDTIDPYGVRFIWDRACGDLAGRTVTAASSFPTKVGWNTYTVDLNSMTIDPTTNTKPWSVGSINGFAVLPHTVANAAVKFDWIRLEDPTTCSSLGITTSYSASAVGNNDRFSLYLDDDANPFNGFTKKLASNLAATGTSSVTINDVVGVAPGSYYVTGILDSDFATLVSDNPWDMEGVEDIYLAGNINNPSFSNGVYSGTAGAGGGQVYLKGLSDISTTMFTKLTFKGTFNSPQLQVFWTNGTTLLGAAQLIGNNTYQIDLGSDSSWTSRGTVPTLILSIPEGAFSIDFVSLRALGFDTTRSATTLGAGAASSVGTLTVNSPPLISVLSPDTKGGEAFQPWNMRPSDVVLSENLNGGIDSTHPAEEKTSYLPDVRLIDGLRGEFFKGTSINDNADPINYLMFPTVSELRFSADQYRNLCFKLLIDRTFDVGLGSVGRILWKDTTGTYHGSDDIILIYDGWSGSRWYEYCADMKNVNVEGGTAGYWNGTIDAFRIDAHEFTPETPFYFDYVKIRKDDEAPGSFNIVWDASDADDTATVDLYASTSPTSLGTLIGSTTSASNTRVFPWNTTPLASGTYYVHARATDGFNTTTRYSTARVLVNNGASVGTPPVLSLQSPTAGDIVCDSMQVKGYSLQSDRFEDVSTIEVLVDGTRVGSLVPSEYSAHAIRDYPSADSSNTGFNTLFSMAAFSPGAHTVQIKAYSSRGLSTTQSIAITKSSTGCREPVIDSSPAGIPIGAGIATPTPTRTPTPQGPTVTISSAKHTKANEFSITVNKLDSSMNSCTLSLLAGNSATTVTSNFLRINLSAKDTAKKRINLLAKKVTASTKAPKQIFIAGRLNCSGTDRALSSVRRVKLTLGKSGAKDLNSMVKLLRKLKKV